MPTAKLWLVAASAGILSWSGTSAREAPSYSAASIVNAAANAPGLLAPNTIVSVYGTNLSRGTASVDLADMQSGFLPTYLPGTGTRVFVGGIAAPLFYVSPTQVNFLIPSDFVPGSVNVDIVVDALYGAGPARVVLTETGPALFTFSDRPVAVATRGDGMLVTEGDPLHPGEIVILWATGLGRTKPAAVSGQLATTAAEIADINSFELTLGGAVVPRSNIQYVGLTPGSAGLYQINLILPDSLPDNPEIRITLKQRSSPLGIRLPFRRSVATTVQPE